jgi:hypothetical protein
MKKLVTILALVATAAAGYPQISKRLQGLPGSPEEEAAVQRGKAAGHRIYLEVFETPTATPQDAESSKNALSNAINKAAEAAYPGDPKLQDWFTYGVFNSIFTNPKMSLWRSYSMDGIEFEFYSTCRIEKHDKNEFVAHASAMSIFLRSLQSELTRR